jgi:hypothetical protein
LGGCGVIAKISNKVDSDGVTVWVHQGGETIARFGIRGIDIHRPINEQLKGWSQCLHCSHGITDRADWDIFVSSVKEHYGIDVTAEHMPLRFKSEKENAA